MRVLVEASSAYDQYAGIGRYARNVVAGLVRNATPETRFSLIRTRDRCDLDLSGFDETVRGIPNHVIPLSRQNAYRLWFRLKAPIDVQWFAGRTDVAYSPDFTMWRTSGVPRIVTVHDLAHLTHPNLTVPGLQRFLEHVVRPEIERAEKIAVVSHATAADLLRFMDVQADRIVYAPNAVDERFHMPSPLTAEELSRLGFPPEFSLMLGTIEPRKNHINAIRAYGQSSAAGSLPLVIAGRLGWGLENILPAIEDAEDRGIVKYVSYVPDDIVPRLMASARMLVFPSWNEGFGLPVVEMLATGGNVVTSRAPALMEVSGGHAECAESDDIDGLTEAINASLELPSRETRQSRLDWVTAQYSWDKTARSLLQSFEQVRGR